MMNTQQMGELGFLHSMVNNPIDYTHNQKPAASKPATGTTTTTNWLISALAWVQSRTQRIGRARRFAS